MTMFELSTTPRRFEDLSRVELEAFLQRGRGLRARAIRNWARALWSSLAARRPAGGRAWHVG
jgi:hypothetical protein